MVKGFLFILILFFSINSHADLAKAKSCNINKDDECELLLNSTIDTLASSGFYCPDGKVANNNIIDAWRKDMAFNGNLQKVSTHVSLGFTINKLGLSCER